MHARGGCIVAQLWHVGRISHTSLLPQGVQPVAPSALRANAKTFTRDGFVDVSQPRVLELDEIPAIVDSFLHAARNAIEAGFDGVEIHGANGYLIDQFLRNGANRRQDAYGGSIENRTRFLVEVMGAVAEEIGAGRVGVRLSPVTPAGDLSDSDPQPLFERAVQRLDALGIAYIHVIEGAPAGTATSSRSTTLRWAVTAPAPGSSTMATTMPWHSTRCRRAKRMPSRSGYLSWPILTCPPDCARKPFQQA